MATIVGRIIRVIAGAALIWWGSTIGGATGIAVMLVGGVPLFAGILNVCMVAPFISVPFKGKDILALPDTE